MNIASFCIKHKVTTILAFIIISIFGFTMYAQLKLTMIPEMTYPGAFVSCYYNGAAPGDVEELVTRPIESVIATMPGVDSIQSTSSENMSMVMINYVDGTDMDMSAIKLREKLDRLTLPEGVMDPVIQNLNLNELMPVVTLTVMGDDLVSVQQLCDTEVKPALERIDGVASVDVFGGVEEQITVAVDSARLMGYNLSINYVSQILAANNTLLPGGDIKNGVQSLTVSTDGKLKTVADVADTLIPLPTGGTIRLSELANVYLEKTTQDSIANSNGEPCVVLAVNKQSDANEVETAKAVNKALADLQKDNASFQYLVVMDSSEYIMQAANSAVQNIVLGVILAAVVVFLFLRRFGATFAIGVSMPFCILTVFVVMKLFDITLNMISLGGIALGVGMIVDNSIVVLENIYRYAMQGHSRFEACVEGTKEVALPVMASTLTTVAVFVPIGLSGGMAGMMFKDFCLTIAFLLLSSLVIAMTLVPLMCYFLLDENKVRRKRLSHDEKAPPFARIFTAMRHNYLVVLRFFIRKRWVAMLISLGMVVLFTVSCASTKSVLMPDVDQGQLSVTIEVPVGTELEQTTALADRVTGIIENTCPELKSMYYSAEAASANLVLNLVSLNERSRSSKEVATALRDATRDVAGCDITITASGGMMSMGAGGGDISVQISGDSHETLQKIAGDLKQQIAALPGAVNVKSSVEDATPGVKIYIKRDQAAMQGLSAATIGSAVRAELSGATATTMTMDGNDIEVVIKGNEAAAQSLDALRSMPLALQTGGQIPLSAVADVAVELSPQTITRNNQSRQVDVTGDIDTTTDLTTITKQIQEIIGAYEMPQGYQASAGGTFEDMNNSFGDLILALLIALGLVYFVLASQFESFIMPIIVMMILPVALTGALFGLPLTGSDLSMVAIVGLIMLAGVVVNASIILVDYIKVRRLMGETKEDAILAAAPLRIRPIMMTTMTTILAMVPMSLGIGEGAELMQPMSIVMISGMIIATIVTLFFTPVYYSLLDSFNEKLGNLFFRKRRRAKREEEAVPLEK